MKRKYPGERFGFGFGSNMGTELHVKQPGFFPSDMPRVTGHRLTQWINDLHGLPFVLVVGIIWAARGRGDPWRTALLASAACVVLVYSVHFYHGIAYGARHYALALPAVVAAISMRLARSIEGGGEHALAQRAAVLALLVREPHHPLRAAPQSQRCTAQALTEAEREEVPPRGESSLQCVIGRRMPA